MTDRARPPDEPSGTSSTKQYSRASSGSAEATSGWPPPPTAGRRSQRQRAAWTGSGRPARDAAAAPYRRLPSWVGRLDDRAGIPGGVNGEGGEEARRSAPGGPPHGLQLEPESRVQRPDHDPVD